MTETGRRGLSVGLILMLALAGGVVWYLRHGEPTPAPASTSATPHPTVTTPAPEAPPLFSMPNEAPTEPLVPAGGDATAHAPTDLPKVGAQLTAPELDPVVAKGRVVWAGGALPDGVDITLFDADGSDLEYATSDKQGLFELRHGDWLADGWAVGSDSTTVKVNGLPRMIVPALVGDLPAHFPTDPPIVLELLVGYAPVLTGHVTDKTTGAPMVAAEVTVSSSHQAHVLDEVSAVTDQTGLYTLPIEDVPMQGLIIWCGHDGYQTVLNGPLDLEPAAQPGDVQVMDFALDPPQTVSGRVVDATSGLPIPDAIVTLGSRFGAFADDSDWEISEADGGFSMDGSAIPVNGAWLLAAADDHAPAAVRSTGPWQFQEIKMGPAITVAGTVTDTTGRPVAGASVRIVFDGDTIDLDQGLYDEASTDAAGHFEVLLESSPQNSGLLQVEAPHFIRYDARLGDVTKPASPDRYEVTVPLTSE